MRRPATPRSLAASLALAAAASTLAAQAPPTVSSVFSGRAARRAEFRNEKVVAAVRSGLGWLLGHQDQDGRWDTDGFMKHDPANAPCDGPGNAVHDVGATALALLAVLAQADPAHQEGARRAADWLCNAFEPRSGRVRSEAHDFVYAQAIATLALTEAAAIFGVERYREAAALGLRYLGTHRNAGAAWRYMPQDGDNDTSVTAWCLAAYGSAFHAGLEVPAAPVGEALAWLESATTRATGHCGYTKRGEISARKAGDHGTLFPSELGGGLTAAGLHARLVTGLSTSHALTQGAAELIGSKPPQWDAKTVDLYTWFHGSAALAHLPGSAPTKRWEAALHKALLPTQHKDGARQGSWDPIDVWGEDGGRIVSTAFAVLSLSSPYRLGRTDALAQLPDVPPFRRAFGLWKDGKVGAAAVALTELAGTELGAEQQAIVRRCQWFVAVESARDERVLATLAATYADVLDRQDRLAEMVAAMTPLPVGKAAEQALQALRSNPALKDEVQASKELRALQKAYDAALASRSGQQRQQVKEKLQKIVDRFPQTAAGKQAFEMMQRL